MTTLSKLRCFTLTQKRIWNCKKCKSNFTIPKIKMKNDPQIADWSKG